MMSKQSSKIASFSRRSVTYEFSSKHSIDVLQECECDEEERIKSEIKLNDGDGMQIEDINEDQLEGVDDDNKDDGNKIAETCY